MSVIFDVHLAKLYESWYLSSMGRAMEAFVEKNLPLLIAPQPGERILEIGCGSGNHLLFLNRLGLNLTGVDASPYMINLCKKRLGSRCTLKTGRAEDLPCEDNEFDIAIFINTLEFLDSPQQALREAGRVARRKIFITVINNLSWQCLLHRISGSFKKNLFHHAQSFNLWQIKSQLKVAYGDVPIGWRSAKIQSHFPPGRWSEKINTLNCPFGPFLGISAAISYTMKTDNLSLKVKKTAQKQSIVEGTTTIRSDKISESNKVENT